MKKRGLLKYWRQENKNFKEFMKSLEGFKVNMSIQEMAEKIHCCMKFLQEILKLK